MQYKEIKDSMYPEPYEADVVCHCCECGNEICENELYVEFDEKIICLQCLDDYSTDDWLKLMDISKKVAQKDIYSDY